MALYQILNFFRKIKAKLPGFASEQVSSPPVESSSLGTHIKQVLEELEWKNQALEKALQELRSIDSMKDQLISIASHELRTPLTVIRSYIWMALNRSDIPLSDKVKEYLEKSLISTERSIDLVSDMLNTSKIDARKVKISLERVSIQQIVEDVVRDLQERFDQKNIKVNLIKGDLPEVIADRGKVREVMMNLLTNSLKYTPSGGSIKVSYFSDGQTVEIGVSDNGIGISKDDLPRLFKRFGRLDNSFVATATSGGTGLGLYICKNLVELMGGKIWAKSDGWGRGATFTFSLPVFNPKDVSSTWDLGNSSQNFKLVAKN